MEEHSCELALYREALIRPHVKLVELVELRPELLDHLYAEQVITPAENDCLRIEREPSEATRIFLLQILRKKTLQHFKIFLQCLINCEQQHVAKLITDRFEELQANVDTEEGEEQETNQQPTGDDTREVTGQAGIGREYTLQEIDSANREMAENFVGVESKDSDEVIEQGYIISSTGYLHNVSEVHQAKSGCRYFTFVLQGSATDYRRCVSYMPAKRDDMKAYEDLKIIVSLKYLKLSIHSDDAFFQKGSLVESLEDAFATFSRQMRARDYVLSVPLEDLTAVEIDQHVSIRVKVLAKLESGYMKQARYQRILVADATSWFILAAWEAKIEDLKTGKSCLIRNCVLCKEQRTNILTEAHSVQAKKLLSLQRVSTLQEIEDIPNVQDPTVKVIGRIGSIIPDWYYDCTECKRSIEANPNSSIVCLECKNEQVKELSLLRLGAKKLRLNGSPGICYSWVFEEFLRGLPEVMFTEIFERQGSILRAVQYVEVIGKFFKLDGVFIEMRRRNWLEKGQINKQSRKRKLPIQFL